MKNNIPKAISIQKRLIVSTVGMATLLIFISWIFVFYETKNEVDEVYDARLGQLAKILALSMPSVMDLAPDIRDKVYADWSKVMLIKIKLIYFLARDTRMTKIYFFNFIAMVILFLNLPVRPNH